jgi:hypothetical protein
LPIVSCLKGELARTIELSGCGQMYESGDAAQLAGVLRLVVCDRARNELLKESARQLFERQFCADRIYEEYVSHLELIHRCAARPA